MSAPRLTTYKFIVIGGTADHPEEHEIETVGRDVQRVEATFADKRWGATQDRPMTTAAMVCYFAMLRAGQFSGTWDAFENWYLSVQPLEPVNADPTVAGLESDLMSKSQ